jgi:hypothetical protein
MLGVDTGYNLLGRCLLCECEKAQLPSAIETFRREKTMLYLYMILSSSTPPVLVICTIWKVQECPAIQQPTGHWPLSGGCFDGRRCTDLSQISIEALFFAAKFLYGVNVDAHHRLMVEFHGGCSCDTMWDVSNPLLGEIKACAR